MSNVDWDELAALLKQKRHDEALSMRDAAEAAGVGLNAYFRAEHGLGVRRPALQSLSDWVEVPEPLLATGTTPVTLTMTVQDARVLRSTSSTLNSAWSALGGTGNHPTAVFLTGLDNQWNT